MVLEKKLSTEMAMTRRVYNISMSFDNKKKSFRIFLGQLITVYLLPNYQNMVFKVLL